MNVFSLFQEIIDKIDSENSELYLLGDLNCDLLSHSPNVNTRELLDICDIYNLTQLITEPTRVTNISQSLIHLCKTNTPDKITASGVQSLGISDHSLVYLVRKSTWQEKTVNSFVHKRQFKYFNENEFSSKLSKIDWNETCASGDPNVMWSKWLLNFTQVLDRRAPLKKKRLNKKRSPWITYNVVQKMRYRDNLKRQYDVTRNDVLWKLYKNARNDM